MQKLARSICLTLRKNTTLLTCTKTLPCIVKTWSLAGRRNKKDKPIDMDSWARKEKHVQNFKRHEANNQPLGCWYWYPTYCLQQLLKSTTCRYRGQVLVELRLCASLAAIPKWGALGDGIPTTAAHLHVTIGRLLMADSAANSIAIDLHLFE